MKQLSKTAYFAISLSNRPRLATELGVVRELSDKLGIKLNVFVDEHHFAPHQEKEMMMQAFEEIEASDFLIAELSKKAIGVGVEVGYAKALGKTIIYLKKEAANYSTTVGGCADIKISYADPEDLKKKLEEKMLGLL
ncbi:MAG: nucleoside 2-deoxyribosyltransferase [Bacteroidota bacterium]